MPAAALRAQPEDQTFDARLSAAAAALWRRAPDFDHDGADPAALCAPLREHGLFRDALPAAEGGADLAGRGPLLQALVRIGGADLSAGRIFEGHVNAVKLVVRYGDAAQRRTLAEAVRAGAVCGVWNAEAPPGLRLSAEGALEGRKIYCSGLGVVDAPLVTARAEQGLMMLMPRLARTPAHDLSGWTVRGMRATATGTVDFTGVAVAAGERIGAADDYYRSPLFKGGAWRFAAVQTGAVVRLAELMRDELRGRGRDGDPHQRARLGQAALAAETAELWVTRAAALAEDDQAEEDHAGADQAGDGGAEPRAVDAYVNLCRLAVEKAALEVLALAERGLGLSAFTRPSPVERVARDLATYLRQPFPDGALEDAAAYASGAEGGPSWSAGRDFPR